MSKSPLVSVIVPVFNTGKVCLKLLEQLLGGTYKNIEIICVDDGSKDDSLKILNDFTKKHDKVIVKTQKNAGPSAARNTGIKLAKGDFISFIDSDDLVSEDFIEKLLNEYLNDKVILACVALHYTRVKRGKAYDDFINPLRARKKNETLREYILYLMRKDGRLYGVITKLFRRDIVIKNNLQFDVTMDFAEDTKFVLDYVTAALPNYPEDCEIHFILEPLYFYNYGTETSTVAKSSLKWQNWKRSYQDLKDWSKKDAGKKVGLRRKAVWARWRVSHALAVARANMPRSEKRKYANPVELFFATMLLKVRK